MEKTVKKWQSRCKILGTSLSRVCLDKQISYTKVMSWSARTKGRGSGNTLLGWIDTLLNELDENVDFDVICEIGSRLPYESPVSVWTVIETELRHLESQKSKNDE